MSSPLDQLIFISLPESIQKNHPELDMDPSVMLPIYIGNTPPQDWDMDRLDWESLEAGLIKVLAWDKERPELPYYKKFFLNLHPQGIAPLLQRAIEFSRQGDFTQAEEIFLAIKQLDPKSSAAALNLAVHYESYARHCAKLDRSEDLQLYIQLATEEFSRALNSQSVPPEAYYMASLFYYSQEDFNQAQNLMNCFLDLSSPRDPRRERAQEILSKLSQLEDEKKCYNQALQFIQDGKDAQGCAKIEEFLERNPQSWNGWFLLGWGLRKQELWYEALDAFDQARDLSEPTADLLNEMAICHMEIGNLDESQELLANGLELSPRDIRIISNQGILAMKMEDLDLARERFQEVLDLDPQDQLAQNYLDFIAKNQS